MAAWDATVQTVNAHWSNDVESDRLSMAVDAANLLLGRYVDKHSSSITDDDAEIMAVWLAIHFAKAGQPDLEQLEQRRVVLPDISHTLEETAEGRRLLLLDPAGALRDEMGGGANIGLSTYGPGSVD